MTATLCPACRLPLAVDDPFDDVCACRPDDVECWTCGALDHDDEHCPYADDDAFIDVGGDLPPAIRSSKVAHLAAVVAEPEPEPDEWVCSECGLVPAAHRRPICAGALLSSSTVLAGPHRRIAVYGSLRHGEGNHAWSLAGLPWAYGNVDGSLFHVAGDDAPYPVCVLGTGERTVVEVYDVDEETYLRIEAMEVGAGYVAVDVPVANAAGPATYTATIFGWSPDRRRGAPVPANDWLRRGAALTPMGAHR